MIWDDTGFLLSKNKYSENSLIAEVFTKLHGKISGIIFGGTSKKVKNYLQIGNELYVNYNSKNENKLGYFKIEILKAYSPFFFDSPKKLFCISSAMQLVKILTADAQKNLKIYELIIRFFKILDFETWIKDYIFWELELFKVLGFDLEFETLVDKVIINNQPQYILKSKLEKKVIPSFLIEKNQNFIELKTLLDGLKLVGDYLEKTILKPNNLNQPITRLQFISTLK